MRAHSRLRVVFAVLSFVVGVVAVTVYVVAGNQIAANQHGWPIIIAVSLLAILLGGWLLSAAVSEEVGRLDGVQPSPDGKIGSGDNSLAVRASFDDLTGLPDRILFLNHLRGAIRQASRDGDRLMALLFLDLDQFKPVNDIFGHAVGDHLLQHIARRLLGLVRELDMLARIGGDEFVLLLDDVRSVDDLATVAENLINHISMPFQVDGNEIVVGLSIGITIFPIDDRSPEKLIQDADIAMYRAKKSRNSYEFFSVQMGEEVHQRMVMIHELGRAMENRQFVLHYQPQVDSITRKILGAEVLIRWNHPERGIIYPDKFITLLEESRLIIGVGEWVLNESLRQHRQWLDAGYPALRLSVNVSVVQLKEQGFYRIVKRALDRYRVGAAWLKLEITESVMMEEENLGMVRMTLEELRKMGVRVAMDDFGTGFSSLQYLQRLPFDILKLDRSFVRNISESIADRKLLNTMVNMAKSLSLDTIAEGVEDETQVDILQQMGVIELQGYYFGYPMKASKLEKLMERDQKFNHGGDLVWH